MDLWFKRLRWPPPTFRTRETFFWWIPPTRASAGVKDEGRHLCLYMWIWSDNHGYLTGHCLRTGVLHSAFVWIRNRDGACSELPATLVFRWAKPLANRFLQQPVSSETRTTSSRTSTYTSARGCAMTTTTPSPAAVRESFSFNEPAAIPPNFINLPVVKLVPLQLIRLFYEQHISIVLTPSPLI